MSAAQWEGAWEQDCRAHPTFLLVDEVQNLDPAVAQRLLTSEQAIRARAAPLCLCLMGTPDLDANLSHADATFWNRVDADHIFSLSPLSLDAAEDAVRAPLLSVGLPLDADALAKVVQDAQGYPYFLQMWGRLAVSESRPSAGGSH